MKLKASWVAWLLFVFVFLATLQEIVTEFSQPDASTGWIGVLADLVIGVFVQGLFALVGALIVSKQPRNSIGWLLLIVPLTQALGFLLPPYQTWPAAPVEPTFWVYLGVWASGWSWVLLIFPVFLLALLFPTGRPPTRRWNWVGYLALVMAALLIFLATFSETITMPDLPWGLPNPGRSSDLAFFLVLRQSPG